MTPSAKAAPMLLVPYGLKESIFAPLGYIAFCEIKNDLLKNGAVYAAMSGSGSTMFGLFHQLPSTIQFSHTPVYEKWVQIGA